MRIELSFSCILAFVVMAISPALGDVPTVPIDLIPGMTISQVTSVVLVHGFDPYSYQTSSFDPAGEIMYVISEVDLPMPYGDILRSGNTVDGKLINKESIAPNILLPNEPRVSPDGKTLAFRGFEKEDDPEASLWTLDLTKKALPMRLTSSEVRTDSPAWSPDGKLIACVRRYKPKDDKEKNPLKCSVVFIDPTQPSVEREKWNFTDAEYGTLQYSPDGRWLLSFSSKGPRLGMFHVESGRFFSLFDESTTAMTFQGSDKPYLKNAFWLPDSQHIIATVTEEKDQSQLWMIPFNGEPKKVADGWRIIGVTPNARTMFIRNVADKTNWRVSIEPKEKQPAIELTLTDVNGKNTQLSSYRGKKTIIHIWATDCPYCLKQEPVFTEFYDTIAKNKAKVNLISIAIGQKEDVSTYLKKHALNYPVYVSDKQSLNALNRIQRLPMTLVLDETGVHCDNIAAPSTELLKEQLQRHLEK